jgi:hypothetical protein
VIIACLVAAYRQEVPGAAAVEPLQNEAPAKIIIDPPLRQTMAGWTATSWRGDTLSLEVQGRTQLDFAEGTFDNGNVQVLDFQEHTYSPGIYERQLRRQPSCEDRTRHCELGNQ